MSYALIFPDGELVYERIACREYTQVKYKVATYTTFPDALAAAEVNGNCDVVQLAPVVRVRTKITTTRIVDPIMEISV